MYLAFSFTYIDESMALDKNDFNLNSIQNTYIP